MSSLVWQVSLPVRPALFLVVTSLLTANLRVQQLDAANHLGKMKLLLSMANVSQNEMSSYLCYYKDLEGLFTYVSHQQSVVPKDFTTYGTNWLPYHSLLYGPDLSQVPSLPRSGTSTCFSVFPNLHDYLRLGFIFVMFFRPGGLLEQRTLSQNSLQ